MARRAEGWRLTLDARSGVYGVRWRKDGARHHVTTGERDPARAAEAAARIYAEAVSGRRVAAAGHRIDLDALAAEWLADTESEADPETLAKYKQYTRAWSEFFGTLDRVTGPGIEDFWRARLRVAKRRTVIKQLYTLNLFLRWLEARHVLETAPSYKMPPKSATGTPAASRREVETVPLSEKEAARILAKMPEWCVRVRDDGTRWRVRDRFTVAWETGLRPATLDAIEAPGDYKPGDRTLRIRDEIDKARFGREVPLSGRAREALGRAVPAQGLIFGRVDSHVAAGYLRRAAKAARLPADKVANLKAYDFRHGRGTQLAEDGGNLVGVAFLLGHKAITTTNRYVHAHRAAAEKVLAAVGTDSGRAGKAGRKAGGRAR